MKHHRLTQILLAGTIVPALVLIPLMPASAQMPDPGDHRMQHPRQDGGEKGPRNPGGMQGQGGHQPGEHAGNGERRPGGQGGPGPRGVAADERKGAESPRDRKPMGDGPGRAQRPDKFAQPERAQNHEGQPSQKFQRADDPGPTKRMRDGDRAPGGPQRAGAPNPDDRRRVGDRLPGDDRRPDRMGDHPGGLNRPDNAHRNDDPGVPRRVGGGDNGRDLPRDVRPRVAPTGIVIGVGAGLAGGFLAATGARRLDDLRRDRREVQDGDRTFIREPGRTIVQEHGRAFIVHDENDRFRELGLDVRRERHGAEIFDTVVRPGGVQIITVTDITGRLLRRIRRTRDGREFVLIDNGVGGRLQRFADDIVVLPPPALRIPRDRYIVDYRAADAGLLYDTLIAPPLVAPPRRYTLDQIRYSPDVRGYLRSVDIDTINFDTGSWDVPASAAGQLEQLATAIKRAIDRDANSVFLVEGFTDATGNPDDNLSLSDRRAQSVAEILSKDFGVPPENLTTQGYGQQNLRENTQGPSAINRRVVVQNITQLLASGDQPPAGQ